MSKCLGIKKEIREVTSARKFPLLLILCRVELLANKVVVLVHRDLQFRCELHLAWSLMGSKLGFKWPSSKTSTDIRMHAEMVQEIMNLWEKFSNLLLITKELWNLNKVEWLTPALLNRVVNQDSVGLVPSTTNSPKRMRSCDFVV
jgi:hypothetical protein